MAEQIQLLVETPGYVMLSSDYSSQEPKLTAMLSADEILIQSFKDGKDVYAAIASIAFNQPYEACLEFHPETHEYQPDGKARRGEAKTILLGILYGRSIPSIAEQLYGTRKDMTDEEKNKGAQHVYDSVMTSFPGLRNFTIQSQEMARQLGYVTTILGRRRHLPDMQLPPFEFKAMPGYINPDVDPLDITTLQNSAEIPERIVKQLEKEFESFKYYGQIRNRTNELAEEKIRVINNRAKIQDATRQCVNCVDDETEILTISGWKNFNTVQTDDKILAFDLNKQEVVRDSIQDVHQYEGDFDVVEFESSTFTAVSTFDHRWICCNSKSPARFITTSHINRNKWPDYPILRVSNNSFVGNSMYTDDILKLLGWILADRSMTKSGAYEMCIYQSTHKKKNANVYASMISTLQILDIPYRDSCKDGVYHEIYIDESLISEMIRSDFPDRQLTWQFVSTLSQHQAKLLMWSMIEGDGTFGDTGKMISYTCNSIEKRDVFQYLAFVAGYATNSTTITPEQQNAWTNNKMYPATGNKSPIQCTKPYYVITILRVKRAYIYPHHKRESKRKFVWCVTTNTGSWVARRHGKVYITGNSRVQGSAADQTKMAILLLENDPEWKAIGGRLLAPVHDELIAEVPIQYAERGGELLSSLMCQAADFLPFPSKCDVETSFRWYGLSYPCPYTRPQSLENLSEDEIRWVQYHLFECEYTLPVFKEEDGSKPRGDAAKGVNGKTSEEFDLAIIDYCKKFNVAREEFLDNIERRVTYGDC